MMIYAGLYGNIKKPRIKNQGDNNSIVDLANEVVEPISVSDDHFNLLDELSKVDVTIPNVHEGVGAIDEMSNKLGKLSLSYIITR